MVCAKGQRYFRGIEKYRKSCDGVVLQSGSLNGDLFSERVLAEEAQREEDGGGSGCCASRGGALP